MRCFREQFITETTEMRRWTCRAVSALALLLCATSSGAQPSSTRGLLKMVNPHRPVLGERFTVSMPLPGGDSVVVLRWWPAHDSIRTWAQRAAMKSDHRMPNDKTFRGPRRAAHLDTVIAPYGRPGKYELGLFKHWGWNYELIDVLPVEVQVGTAPDGIRLLKRVVKPGDPIDLWVTLPPNRYYFGHWSGATVLLYPLVIEGRRIPAAEAEKASKALWLNTLVQDVTRGDGVSSASRGTRPGTYLITQDTAAKYRLNGSPFQAPRQHGQYEIRLYDRGYPSEDYLDLVLAADTLVVGPDSAPPVVTRFVRRRGGTWEALTTVAQGDSFQVEARFDTLRAGADSATRGLILEWMEGGVRRTRAVSLVRISRGLYRSRSLLLVPSAHSSATRSRQP